MRDDATGSAVGYILSNGFAVNFGNTLCELKQISRVVWALFQYLSSDGINLKPIWCCVDKEIEKCLVVELGWSVVIAVAEERLNTIEVDPDSNDKTVERRILKVEWDSVKVVEIERKPDDGAE